ncbi:lysophospholipid acyltransferase family protein [Vibrio mytili]|uniref:lysophospholipid acyltransferase family protein n=1 Tax=Vibrio mytili TaxID=50718 RepID=UPI002F3F34FE
MKRLNQYWRVLATGCCFVLFGLGGLLLSFIIIPILRFFVSNPTEREYKVQKTIQFAFNTFCKLMKFSRVMDYEIIGADILRRDRNCLIVANHPSLIDYVLIASQLPSCDCLVKSAIWSNPFMKQIVKAAGYIPNETPDDLISLCEKRFNAGNVLLIFPEGTRTTPGVESKIQRGAAQIAVRTKRDIRIIHISVSPNFLTKQTKWYQVPSEKPFFQVEVKDKVEIAPFIKQTTSPTLAARRVQQHLADSIFPDNTN